MKFFPKRVDKPWGYEAWWAHNEHYVGKLIHVDAGKRLSWQYHNVKDETMYCLSGDAILVVEEEGKIAELTLNPGESFRITPGTKHRLKAGVGGCDVLEASTPQVEDVVRLDDDYGRQS